MAHRGDVRPASSGGVRDMAEDSSIHLALAESGVALGIRKGGQRAVLAPVRRGGKKRVEMLDFRKLQQSQSSQCRKLVQLPHAQHVVSEQIV